MKAAAYPLIADVLTTATLYLLLRKAFESPRKLR